MINKHLDIHPAVQKALDNQQAVVALESTIISHGMPYPQNAETALQVEHLIREEGAVPATIAIINGRLKAGLSEAEIHHLGREGANVAKTSRRDIPFIVSKKMDGATTVASTMIIAAMAGIRIFATGGIGGVHRGATETMDVSADLQELSATNVAVVSAGAKAILDLGLTLEYLETHGVPVIGFGTDEFPAFYSRKSGFGVDYRVDATKELAQALKTKWDLGLTGGAVIANPIPKDFEMELSAIQPTVLAAIKEAEQKGIKGKAITPFLLSRIEQLSEGESLKANIQLVFNNARLAAQIALELATL